MLLGRSIQAFPPHTQCKRVPVSPCGRTRSCAIPHTADARRRRWQLRAAHATEDATQLERPVVGTEDSRPPPQTKEEQAPHEEGERLPFCQHGGVVKVMRAYEQGLIKCTPGDTLEGIVPTLTQITGMPVVDDHRRVVGVISKKDVLRVKKAGGSLQQQVSEAMTAPALTVPITATVQEAADIMMDKKVRPLPVVDAEGKLLGIVARSDIFKPLFKEQFLEFMGKDQAVTIGAQADVEAKEKQQVPWKIKYLYDGDCSMCQSLKTVLEKQDKGNGAVAYVNIADYDYDPSRNMGVRYEDAMDTIHAIRNTGEVLKGTEALKALFEVVGLSWVVKLSELPILAGIVELTYNNLTSNRLSLGGAVDAIIAVLIQLLSLLPNFQPSFHGFGLLLFWKRAQCKPPEDDPKLKD